MTHVCDLYFRKHGHYPRVVVTSGVQRITVEFAPGYVMIRSSHPYASQVYITRSAFRALLKKMLPLTRTWLKAHPRKDFDVPAAMQHQYHQEMLLLQEKRALKKARGADVEDVERQRRQRQRFLRARARAARKARGEADASQ